jgi:hypothetical protein
MAWIDDRIWCHPKIIDLPAKAQAAYMFGLAYSSGMATGGKLTHAQQRLIGSDAKTRAQLVDAGLWDENGDSATVTIHDWDDHNGKRDERRERERQRKKEARWRRSQ